MAPRLFDERLKRTITASMIYRFGGQSLRRQVLFTVTFIVVSAVSLGAYALFAVETPGVAEKWISPANILAAAMMLFSLGILREQFNEVKRRLGKLEEFNEKELPGRYVRRDVLEAAGFGVPHVHKRDGDL